jgi:hypothetical protein
MKPNILVREDWASFNVGPIATVRAASTIETEIEQRMLRPTLKADRKQRGQGLPVLDGSPLLGIVGVRMTPDGEARKIDCGMHLHLK